MCKTHKEAGVVIVQQSCTKLKQTMVIVYDNYLSTYFLHLYLAKHMSESYDRNRFRLKMQTSKQCWERIKIS